MFLERSILLIKVLLEAGADIDRQLKVDLMITDGPFEDIMIVVTPLILAVICGFTKAVSVPIDAGARWEAIGNGNFQDEDIQSSIALCSLEKLLKRIPQFEYNVRRIIEVGGLPILTGALDKWTASREREDQDNSGTYASSIDDLGNDLNDDLSSQELFVAAYQKGSWDTVRELITTQPEIELNRNDSSGMNAVYCAAAAVDESSALAFLLENGVDPNTLTSFGFSALIWIVANGYLEKTSMLLQYGANIDLLDPYGCTPLLVAVRFGYREIVELLLDRGANINAVTNEGFGVLQLAIQGCDTNTFSLLLARGADSTLSDNYESTPLHEACERGLDIEVIKLLETVSNPRELINSEGLVRWTPLCIAAANGFEKIIKILLDNEAEINRAGRGHPLGSALNVAFAMGHENTAKILLMKGACQTVEGSRFKSAIEIARAFRQEVIVRILEDTASA